MLLEVKPLVNSPRLMKLTVKRHLTQKRPWFGCTLGLVLFVSDMSKVPCVYADQIIIT